MSLIAELKRRNVIRMAGLYLVGAWLLVQVASTLLPMFGAPDWLPRSIVIVLALGFVPALVLAWVFELTPEGLKRDAEVTPEESIAPQTARRMERTFLIVLVVALAYLGFDKLVLAPRRDVALVASAQKQAVSQAAASPAVSKSAKSIAVLPFVELGGDDKDSYLGDGISAEVLTALSKLPGLKVIGRASSFQFRGANVDTAKVGRELKVLSLLTGTVQRAGDQLRITVELLDTASGVQLWTQRYDRDFKNLFALEDDISGAVSKALAVQLGAGGSQPLVVAGTRSPHAHDLYLRARELSFQSDEASLNQALVLFNQVLAEDPNYAAAWAGLASNYEFLADAYRSPDELLPAMKGAAEKAVALDPNLAEGHLNLGYILMAYERDLPAGQRELERGIALNPSSADGRMFLGLNRLVRQDPAAAQKEFELCAKIDPRNPWCPYTGTWVATAQGDYAGAISRAKHVLEIDPGFYYLDDPLMYAYAGFGRWQECIDRSNALQAAGREADATAAVCYAHLGDTARARSLLAKIETTAAARYVDHYFIAQIYVALGDHDRAFAALEQAYRDRSASILYLWFQPQLKPLRDDPRYRALIDKTYASLKQALAS